MHAHGKQQGREQARIVDAHRVHPAMAELHVAVLARGGLLGGTQRIAGDAAAHVLEADLAQRDGLAALTAAGEDELAQHFVLDQRQEFVEALILVMVAVDIDDQDVVEVALHRLLAGMGKEPAGIELFERYPAAAISEKVHDVSCSVLVPVWAHGAGARATHSYMTSPMTTSPSAGGRS